MDGFADMFFLIPLAELLHSASFVGFRSPTSMADIRRRIDAFWYSSISFPCVRFNESIWR